MARHAPFDLEPLAVTDEQQQKLLDIVRANPGIGTVIAARQAGIVQGTTGEVRALLQPYAELLREARVGKVATTIYEIAADPGHKSCVDAGKFVLSRQGGPEWQDKTDINLNANVTVERREVSLHGVLHVLAEAGALDGLGDAGPLRALASARPVLPAQPD